MDTHGRHIQTADRDKDRECERETKEMERTEPLLLVDLSCLFGGWWLVYYRQAGGDGCSSNSSASSS